MEGYNLQVILTVRSSDLPSACRTTRETIGLLGKFDFTNITFPQTARAKIYNTLRSLARARFLPPRVVRLVCFHYPDERVSGQVRYFWWINDTQHIHYQKRKFFLPQKVPHLWRDCGRSFALVGWCVRWAPLLSAWHIWYMAKKGFCFLSFCFRSSRAKSF